MAEKFASPEGTKKYAERFPQAASGHFRAAQALTLSSIGIGTYLGNWDAATDESYAEAIAKFVASGGNVVDTAANYRFQRSERAIGNALQDLAAKGFARDEIFISTKGGYLPFDNEPPTDVRAYFQKEFVDKGIATFDDLVGGSHSMTPAYLQSQIDQSLRNMRLDAIDLYYLHNPESQLGAVDKYTFEARLAKAFEKLEENRAAGKIRFYGAATWNGFRVAPDNQSYHSLERMVGVARQVGGENHGFKFIQLPYNLAMPEAYLLRNQAVTGKVFAPFEAAESLGVAVMCSASILQGKLAHSVPLYIRQILGNPTTDAMTSIEFVRSTPHVTTALVGMSRAAHVEENMNLVSTPVVSPEKIAELFETQ
ncbi:MAG TPA: aldo/keto reductase [Pyrinomonadaceae bacterium]|jgi:aryl-alcohol dehydrogenase-like predicted oxidoreductase